MEPRRRVRVKICCIQTVEEAHLAIDHGADALGLVSAMPSGPGVIDDSMIAEIARSIPPPISTFLLTSRQTVEHVVEQVKRCGTDTVQLCDRLPFGAHRKLRRALPHTRFVQVVHVGSATSVAEALAVADEVDALLLDSGNQTLPTKELGGTGRTHDWRLSRQIVDRSPVPVFLAGGLNDDNVADAIHQVLPYGVDLCSGVRRDGRLDPDRLGAFFAALGRARPNPADVRWAKR